MKEKKREKREAKVEIKRRRAAMRNQEKFFPAFKKFITRGNVVDMAVGVVIGASFTSIVNGLVSYIINPFIGFITAGEHNIESFKSVLAEEILDEAGEIVKEEIAIYWGKWIQTVITFLITALCMFLVLRLIMRMKEIIMIDKIEEAERRAKAAEEKVKAEKEAADAHAAEIENRQRDAENSMIRQEKLLEKILEKMSESKER